VAFFAPIRSDGNYLFGITLNTRVNSLDSKKRQALRPSRMPTGLLDVSVGKVRHKSILHFPVTIWAKSLCHLALRILVYVVGVKDRTAAMTAAVASKVSIRKRPIHRFGPPDCSAIHRSFLLPIELAS